MCKERLPEKAMFYWTPSTPYENDFLQVKNMFTHTRRNNL